MPEGGSYKLRAIYHVSTWTLSETLNPKQLGSKPGNPEV